MLFAKHISVALWGSLAAVYALPSLDRRSNSAKAKAVYFMSNDDTANAVYALPVAQDGTVSSGTVTLTGGKGARMASSVGLVDALNSQGSIQRVGNLLILVNPGSNTISTLVIDPSNPLKLTLLGTPVSSQGDFPNTLAVSKQLRLACVANTGTRAGIACFRITSSGLKPLDKTLRPITLSPPQANPPVGPFNTVSQTFFSADLTGLYTTVKGDPQNTPVTTGYFSYFPIINGRVSYTETRSSPPGTVVLFGGVALPNNRALVTDAAFGTALISINPQTHVASILYKYVVPNNGATCWAVQSPETGDIYTTDDGVNQVVRVDPSTGHEIATTLLPNGNSAMIEIQAVGKYLYAISHGNATYVPHIIVMTAPDATTAAVQQVQNYVPGHGELTDNVDGMALLTDDEFGDAKWGPFWKGQNGGWNGWWNSGP